MPQSSAAPVVLIVVLTIPTPSSGRVKKSANAADDNRLSKLSRNLLAIIRDLIRCVSSGNPTFLGVEQLR